MKKEYWAIIVGALIILGYVLDIASGPIRIPIRNPFDFFNENIISIYPFTGVSIIFKALGVFVGVLLLLSFIEKMQLAKGGLLFLMSVLFELYSIQQLATGGRLISFQWTLGLSFAGVALLVPALIYLAIGMSKSMYKKNAKDPYTDNEDLDL